MDWYIVDKKYVSYLRKFDYKVGHVEYGDKLKLHIGILIEIDGIKYYVPVSSPKEKHNKMSNGLDFHKVVDDKVIANPESILAKRCCNFKLLEEKSKEYDE